MVDRIAAPPIAVAVESASRANGERVSTLGAAEAAGSGLGSRATLIMALLTSAAGRSAARSLELATIGEARLRRD